MTDTIKWGAHSKALEDADYAIDVAADSWQAAQKNTQIALVSIVFNMYQHNDTKTTVDRANRLIEVSKAGNQKAIVEWLVTFGFTAGPEGFTDAPSREVIAERCGTGFKEAKELQWWTLKPQKPFEGYTTRAALEAFLTKHENMVKTAANDSDKASKIEIDDALVNAVKAALAA